MLQWPLWYMYHLKSSLSLYICQRVGLLYHMVLLFLDFFFLRKSVLFSTVAVPIYIPINKVEGFLFSRPLQLLLLADVLMTDILTGVKWYLIVLIVLICISILIIEMLSIFSCASLTSVCLLWKNFSLDPLPIFWLGCLFVRFLYWAVCKFWRLIPCFHHIQWWKAESISSKIRNTMRM